MVGGFFGGVFFFCSYVYQRCNVLAVKWGKNGLFKRKIQVHGHPPGISLKRSFLNIVYCNNSYQNPHSVVS